MKHWDNDLESNSHSTSKKDKKLHWNKLSWKSYWKYYRKHDTTNKYRKLT